jgi:hypothetical protein
MEIAPGFARWAEEKAIVDGELSAAVKKLSQNG